MNLQRPGTPRHWGWGASESSLRWRLCLALCVSEGGRGTAFVLEELSLAGGMQTEAATALPLTSNLTLLSPGSPAP